MPQRRLQRLRIALNRCRQKGWPGLVEMLRHNLYKRETLVRVRLDLTAWQPVIVPQADQVARLGGSEDLVRLRKTWPGEFPPDSFNVDRLYGVTWFYVGFDGPQPVHITWVFEPQKRTPLIELMDGEVELQFCYTLPDHRGQGLFRNTLAMLLADLRNRGITTVYAHVDEENTASLRGFQHAGFSKVATLHTLRLFGGDIIRSAP